MADIFVSYGRSTEGQARQVAEALRAAGYSVWRDDELPAHRSYSDVIEERLRSAKAVVVLWSAEAARSQWVRAEADIAREAGTLVQVTVDGILPPIPFSQIQCADLNGWSEDSDAPGWQKVLSSIALLVGNPAQVRTSDERKGAAARRVAICVLPFINLSGDAEQEYFSDGITDDIITDLSKVSALSVTARNTAFTLKGQTLEAGQIGRQLNVTHVLEGSIRKSGDRVRINAQLIDAEAGDHVWADRYDRDLTDIFAIQDEISKAIVSALRVKLLPKEKKAIESRGTSSVEAYNLYLMARQHWISGNDGDIRRDEVVVRIARQATEIDPDYAKAWALIALAQAEMRFRHDRHEDALAAAERALELDPNLPEALCVKARYLADEDGKSEEADRQIQTALRLDPESWEVNKEAARLLSRSGQMREAIPYFEKAASVVESDYHSTGMLETCYAAVGDAAGLKRAAEMTLERAQRVLAQDPAIGSALGFGAVALAILGDGERSKEWIKRALLMDPDNFTMRWNLVCSLSRYLNDKDAAIELLTTFIDRAPPAMVKYLRLDTDLDPLRDDPRFEQMVQAQEQRVASEKSAAA
ncbi:TIR domain-containing protein [Sphingomonas segetis]|jgi:adenylate cyclase|uniref:TIR domain-containing protein n=1 Tax=Sphingomonas segetis TaxID=1104779 RepID=UPI0012D34CEC|nr:TIR domain-containing protein [Sphingomonas segetis]